MEFLLKNFERHKERGLAGLRAGDKRAARHDLLKAAEYLFRLAAKSKEPLCSSRKANARKLLEMAKAITVESASHAGKAAQGVSGCEDAETGKASRWIVTQKPGVSFADVAGLEDVKDEIAKRVIYPFRHPAATERFKKQAGGGVLLYGPPGTGKTMMAQAIAAEIDAVFFSVRCSDIMSKWVGEAERNLNELFEQARAEARAVIFLDEVESIVAKRGKGSTVMDRVIPEFLSQVDGFESKGSCLLLLGATNRPWDMDAAALRTGRFGRKIYVGLPDLAARRKIVEMRLEEIPLAGDVDAGEIAELLEGYSGADIAGSRGVIDTATDFPYSRAIDGEEEALLTRDDILQAIEAVTPTVSKKMLARYDRFAREG